MIWVIAIAGLFLGLMGFMGFVYYYTFYQKWIDDHNERLGELEFDVQEIRTTMKNLLQIDENP